MERLAKASVLIDWESLSIKRDPNKTEWKSYGYDNYSGFNHWNGYSEDYYPKRGRSRGKKKNKNTGCKMKKKRISTIEPFGDRVGVEKKLLFFQFLKKKNLFFFFILRPKEIKTEIQMKKKEQGKTKKERKLFFFSC